MRDIGIILALLLMLALLSGCSIGKKSWGMAGSADAFKVVMTDAKNQSMSPEIVAGGGCYASLFALPYSSTDNIPTMIAYSKRKSMWGFFDSMDTGNIAFVYISGSKENPEETIKILNAISKITQAGEVEK
jgi:hypothetical protein